MLVNIEKIYLKNQNDDKILKKGIIKQVYAYPEKKVIVVNEIGLTENYLVYINKVENVTIDKNSEDYKNYSNLTKIKIANDLYNTYDNYLNSRYEIDINYQALDAVKNYYN